jgi:quercetin dioxygenase-like cupin family protein
MASFPYKLDESRRMRKSVGACLRARRAVKGEQNMSSSHDPYMLTHQQGLAVWFLGTLMQFKATGADTGQTFSLIEQTLSPGFSPPLHIHRAEDEAFYVLEGDLTFVCGEHRWHAGAGSFIFLPREIAHSFLVGGSEPARLLQFTFPAGLENFHAEMGEPAPSLTLPPMSQPDMEKMQALAAKYHFEIVGPPLGHE